MTEKVKSLVLSAVVRLTNSSAEMADKLNTFRENIDRPVCFMYTQPLS